MFRFVLVLGLAVAGSGATATDGPRQQALETQSLTINVQDLRHGMLPDQQALQLRTPVKTVTSLRYLPDGTAVRQCDVVHAGHNHRLSSQPRGEWISYSRELER